MQYSWTLTPLRLSRPLVSAASSRECAPPRRWYPIICCKRPGRRRNTSSIGGHLPTFRSVRVRHG